MKFLRSIFGEPDEPGHPAGTVDAGPDPVMAALAELEVKRLREALAAAAPAFGPLVEPDSHDFLRPGDMPARIIAFCQATGQEAPETRGEILRCTLESLALKYRWVLERLERMLGRRLETIHIVGGGAQNRLLCQFAADATRRRSPGRSGKPRP